MRTDTGEAAEFERRVSTAPQLAEALRTLLDAAEGLYATCPSMAYMPMDRALPAARAALTAAGVTP